MYKKRPTEDSYSIAAALIIVALFLITFWLVQQTKTDTVNVTSRTWRIEQQIEDFQPRYGEGWGETVPSDAYNRHEERRSRGSHEICSGSGEDKVCVIVPNYDTWVTYTVDRWQYFSAYVETGTVGEQIIQPEPSTRCTQIEEYGCQRYGALTRTFTINFLRPSDGSTFSCNYDRHLWENADDDSYQMTFGLLGNEARCYLLGTEENERAS